MNAPNTIAIAQSIATIQAGMPSQLLSFCSTPITASPSPQAVTPASMLGITAGMQLSVDVTNPETITVTAVTGSTFSAIFTKNHGTNGVQWTIGEGSPLYTLVKVGAVTDPTDVIAFCAITFDEAKTTRYSSGWRVDDRPVFLIESGFDMTDATAAEQSLMTARDVLIPIYLASVSLNATPGVYITLLPQPDKAAYKVYPQGRIYRVHHLMVQAAAQYNIAVAAI
jgi:hypothetical protein